MPQDQQLVNLIATNGAIILTGGSQPTFIVNFPLLRGILQPEQLAMTNVTPVTRIRRHTGDMTLNPPAGGNPVIIPTIILLGADGKSMGAAGIPENGETVILDELQRDGHILIAAGGNGAPKEDSDGGMATVIAGNENLIIALGGDGNSPTTQGIRGGNGGHATAVGIRSGNDIFCQGGVGGNGAIGKTGTAGIAGSVLGIVPAVAGGMGGIGSRGGTGGKAYIVGGESSFGEAIGGNGGTGGNGGAGGAGAPGNILKPAAAAGGIGNGGRGGDGGNVKLTLGLNSVYSTATLPGTAGAGGTGFAAGPGGIMGKTEK